MRISEQSPKGVAGLRMLLVESEQLTPCSHRTLASATPRTHSMVAVAPHQEQIGRRQHRHRDAGSRRDAAPSPRAGPAAAARAWPYGRPRRGRRAGIVGQLADQMDVHVLGVLPTSRCMSMSTSNSRASSKMRRICPARRCRSSARRRSPWRRAFKRLDQQFVGAGKVDQPFLREHAELDVDRPFVFVDQRCTPSKPRMPMPGSTSTCVRMRVVPCLMHFSSVAAARACTSSTVMSCLTGVTPYTGLSWRVLRRAAVDDARLVEMDVGLDQARAGEQAFARHRPARRRQSCLIAAMRLFAMPISIGGPAEPASRAFLMTRSKLNPTSDETRSVTDGRPLYTLCLRRRARL